MQFLFCRIVIKCNFAIKKNITNTLQKLGFAKAKIGNRLGY